MFSVLTLRGYLSKQLFLPFSSLQINGTVNTQLVDGDYTYIGGSFSSVIDTGKIKSSGAVYLDGQDGSFVPGFLRSCFNNGAIIRCSVVDGGYIYLGGTFTTYNDANVVNIVKINISSGVIDPYFNPPSDINGTIRAIAIDGDNLYVGGDFTTYNSKTRQRIVKINKNTAVEVDADTTGFSTASGFNSSIYSIIVNSGDLFVGGSFTTYKGNGRSRIAKLNKTDASDSNFSSFGDIVYTLTIDGENLYVGGAFSDAGMRIAKINKNTGVAVDPIDTNFRSLNKGYNGTVRTLAIDGDNLYVGGDFTAQNGINKSKNQALLNKTDASLVSTVTASSFSGSIYKSVVDGDYVYVVGSFTSYNEIPIKYIARIYIPTGALDTNFNPGTSFDSSPGTIILDGNNLYVGGSFTTYNGKKRRAIVKINKYTAAEADAEGIGFSLEFGITGTSVRSFFIDGDNLYVGGSFNGFTPKSKSMGLALLNKTDASLVPSVSASMIDTFDTRQIYCSVVDGDYIYVGGYFTTYNGVTRNRIAKIHIPTGALDTTFDPGVGFGGAPFALVVDGNNLYAGGDFTSYKGNTRQRIVKIDKTTAAEVDADGTGFSTASGFGGGVSALAIDGNNLYVGGGFTTYKTNTRQYIVKIDKTTAAEVDADGTGFSTASGFDNAVRSITIDGNNLYAGGFFTAYKGNTRQKIVKIHKNTAAEIDADGTGFSTTSGFDYGVGTLVLEGSSLYVGGSFENYKGTTRRYVVKIDKTNATIDTNFNAALDQNNNAAVNSMAIDASGLYLGGNFTYGNQSKDFIKVNKASGYSITQAVYPGFRKLEYDYYGSLVDYSYVYTISLSAYGVSVGGTFERYGYDGGWQTRRSILKLNKNTGLEVDADGTNFAQTTGFTFSEGSSVSDGGINAFALDGNNLYIGGIFTKYRDSNIKGMVKVDKNTSLEVDASGTNFRSVFQSFGYIANSSYYGEISSILIDGNSLYFSGHFSDFSASYAQLIAKIDKTTAAIDSTFNTASAFGTVIPHTIYGTYVRDFFIDGNDLYAVGNFYTYKTNTRRGLIKINKATAAEVDANNTGFSTSNAFSTGSTGSPSIYSVKNTSYGLLVSGIFALYKSDTGQLIRQRISKINKNTAAEVDADGTGFSTTSGFGDYVTAITTYGNNLYVGGNFTTYKGNTRQYIAKIDKTTAAEVDVSGTGFSTTSGFSSTVNSISNYEDKLYISGSFSNYKNDSTFYNIYGMIKADTATGSLDNDFNNNTKNNNGIGGSIGTVYSFAIDGNNLYVGGEFTNYKGLSRSRLIKINKNTAAEVDANTTGFSTTSGFSGIFTQNPIYALTIDGNNLYVGGSFTSYKGSTRQYIAKIDKTTAAEVDISGTGFSTTSGFNSTVNQIILDGDYLYTRGSFSSYKGTGRAYIAKINKNTAVSDASSDSDIAFSGLVPGSTVLDMTVDSSGVYVAGQFDRITNNKVSKSQYATVISKEDASISNLLSVSSFDGRVRCSIVDGDYVYVGGNFTTYNGVTRNRIAKIHIPTGVLDTTFDPGIGFGNEVNTIILDGNNLYAGGYFTSYKGSTRQYIAKIDKTTAAEVDTSGTGFSTTSGFNNTIWTLAVDGDNLYVGGDFTSYKGSTRLRIAKINKTTAENIDAGDVNFNTINGFDNTVFALAIDGNNLYVGGSFNNYRNLPQFNIVKIDKINGSLIDEYKTGFNYNILLDSSVYALTLENSNLYVGGNFTTITKTNKNRYSALLNKTDASLVSTVNYSLFNSQIMCSVVDGDYIYVGGDFTSYNGVARNRIAKIHIPTGALDTTFDPGTGFNGLVRSIVLDGDTLYAGGDFNAYKGNPRGYVVKLNKTTAVEVDTGGTGFSIHNRLDNAVFALMIDGDNLYLGGSFLNYRGSIIKSGYGALLNKADASLVSTVNASLFSATVRCSVVDGDYVYVGGDFTAYNAITRNRIAKIHIPTGTLDTAFDPGIGFSGSVYALAIDGNNLYVGGNFTSYKNNTRYYLAKINKNTAMEIDQEATGFSTTSGFGNTVYALAIDGNNLYAGGNFTTYKGNTRQYIAKIDKTTAAEVDTIGTGFSTTSGFNSIIYALTIDGNNLYVGGTFTTYKGNPRQYIAKIDKTTAAEVDTIGTGFSSSILFGGSVFALALDGNNLYVGGSFGSIGRVNKSTYSALLNKADASLVSAVSASLFNGTIRCSVIDGDYVYVGGDFTGYNGYSRNKIVKIYIPTGSIDTTFDPGIGFNNTVQTLAIDGNNLYVGGNFTTYKGNTRQYIAKIDKTTAAEVDTSGTGFSTTSGFNSIIYALAIDGNNLYAGGSFTTYKGNTRQYIAKIDKTTAAEVDADTTGFSTTSGFDSVVYALALDGNNLYVGGSFTIYKSNTRNRIAKIDKTTAAEVDTSGTGFSANSGFNSTVYALAIDGNNLYVGGNFTYLSKTNRSKNGALLNKTDASLVSTVNASFFNNNINCSIVDGDYIYVGGSFTNYNGVTRNRIAKIHIPTGTLDTTFNPGIGFNDQVYALAIDGNNLYVGGFFTTYKSNTRNRIVKIDKTTAAEVDADTTGFSTTSGISGTVYALAIDGNNLYIGGYFSDFRGNTRQCIAKINKTTAAEVDTSGTGFSTTSGFGNTVYALAIDGNNLYVGGNFTTYKGNTRQYIAKIDKTTAAEVDTSGTGFSTTSGFNSTVYALAIDGNNLYVGGFFTTYKGSTRQYIAKINKTTAAEVDADTTGFSTTSGFNSTVRSIAIDGNNLYAGGDFTTYKGNTRQRITKIDKTTAAEVDASGTGFSTTSGFDGFVNSLVSSSYGLSVFGAFTAYKTDISSSNRLRIVKINKTTAVEVDADGTGFSIASGFDSTNSVVYALAIDGNNLYIGGDFTSYKANTRQRIVKIDKTTAAEVDASGTGFSTTSGFDSIVYSVRSSSYGLSVFGNFTAYKTDYNYIARQYIAKINKTTAAEVDADTTGFSTTSGFNSTVRSIAIDGNNLYAGGDFTTYKGNTRQYIAKIDKTTAAEVDTSGTGFSTTSGFNSLVYSVRSSSYGLSVFGAFTAYKTDAQVNKNRQRILKLNKTTAAEVDADTTGFSTTSGFDSTVRSIAIDGNNLYIGGNFTTYKGNTRQYIAKINKTTAAEVDTSGTGFSTTSGFNSIIYALAIDGNNLYAGGSFTTYKGNTRQYIAKIDKTTAAEVDTSGTGFSTTSGFGNTVLALAIDGSNLYAGGNFTTYKGNTRQYIAKIDKTTAAEVDTSGTGFSTTSGFNNLLNSISISTYGLSVFGNFTAYKTDIASSSTRQRILKLNKITAAEVDTDTTGFSTISGFNGTVYALTIDSNNLYAGGAFTTYKGNTRQYIAKIDKTTAVEVDASGTGFSTTSGFNSTVYNLIINGNSLYVGGNFTYSNKEDIFRKYIAKINKTTGKLDTDFKIPNNDINGFAYSLALDGDNLYVGGAFTIYNSKIRQRLIKINKNTALETDADETGFSTASGFSSASGIVYTIVIDSKKIHIGGYFTTYKNTTISNHVFVNKETSLIYKRIGLGGNA